MAAKAFRRRRTHADRPHNKIQEDGRVSVAEMFEDFCGQLSLPQSLRGSIATRTARIVGRLNSDFRGIDSDTTNRFYAGSYGRSTAVPGFSDIDLIIQATKDDLMKLEDD